MTNCIRVLRAIKGVSQQEVARALKVRVQTIHFVETNKYVPSLLLGMRLAKYFGVPVDNVFTLDDEDLNIEE